MNFNPLDLLIAAIGPLLLSLLLGGRYIAFLQKRYMGQYIREDGPQSHLSKAGTPTAGGVLILICMALPVLLLGWIHGQAFFTPSLASLMLVTFGLGGLGFIDDYLKITKKQNKGVTGYMKLMVQFGLGYAIGWIAMNTNANPHGTLHIFNWAQFNLELAYPFYTAFVVMATSNALNLTDGLDGLASGTALLSFMTLSMMLAISKQPGLSLLSQAFAGASLGFLVFNRNPARIFMGDTGSLALGGALATLAMLGGFDFWLILLASVYILETLSVIIQVVSFKTRGKRVFRMSPLHHHYELGGWSETRVVFTFVTFQFVTCALAGILYNFSVQ